LISQLLFIIIGPCIIFLFRYVFRYKIENLKEVRSQYKNIRKVYKGPLLICPNHLTLIDSVIHGVALNSIMGHFFNFSYLPWNVPERKNFYTNWVLGLLCYLTKCIPVKRGGSFKEGRISLKKMAYVLIKGDALSLFPEGKRSRSGNVDTHHFSYGPGHLLQMVPHAKVLCVSMKGKSSGFADFPPRGETFQINLKLFSPKSSLKGRHQIKDLSTQVILATSSNFKESFENEL